MTAREPNDIKLLAARIIAAEDARDPNGAGFEAAASMIVAALRFIFDRYGPDSAEGLAKIAVDGVSDWREAQRSRAN